METELDEDALELAERIADFTDRHPEITVAAPDATESHLWEMRVGDGLAQWDNGWRLWLYLQAAYDLQARVIPVRARGKVIVRLNGHPHHRVGCPELSTRAGSTCDDFGVWWSASTVVPVPPGSCSLDFPPNGRSAKRIA
jgi:hypothetical protein